jgi:hypothetical protein
VSDKYGGIMIITRNWRNPEENFLWCHFIQLDSNTKSVGTEPDVSWWETQWLTACAISWSLHMHIIL